MQLRELNVEQMEQIKEFFVNVFTKEPWNDDWSDKEQLHAYILDLICNPNSLTLALYEGENMVALSMGMIKHWYEGTEYCVHELCVKTSEQGRGIGTTFLEQMEEHLKAKGMKHIFLLTDRDVPAYNFYKKNKFVELENSVAFAKGL